MGKVDKAKEFFRISEKLKTLERHLANDDHPIDKEFAVSQCLSELYCCSKYLVELVDDMEVDTSHDFTAEELDVLLKKLVYCEIQIFHEMFFWAKELRWPLKKIEETLEARYYELNPEDDDDE